MIAPQMASNVESSALVSARMLARCYAELARPEFPDLIAKVAESHPTEAAALQAVYHARKSEWPAAAKSLNDLFSRLAKNPWVIAEIADSAITQSAVIAQGAPADARQRLKWWPPRWRGRAIARARRRPRG